MVVLEYGGSFPSPRPHLCSSPSVIKTCQKFPVVCVAELANYPLAHCQKVEKEMNWVLYQTQESPSPEDHKDKGICFPHIDSSEQSQISTGDQKCLQKSCCYTCTSYRTLKVERYKAGAGVQTEVRVKCSIADGRKQRTQIS